MAGGFKLQALSEALWVLIALIVIAGLIVPLWGYIAGAHLLVITAFAFAGVLSFRYTLFLNQTSYLATYAAKVAFMLLLGVAFYLVYTTLKEYLYLFDNVDIGHFLDTSVENIHIDDQMYYFGYFTKAMVFAAMSFMVTAPILFLRLFAGSIVPMVQGMK